MNGADGTDDADDADDADDVSTCTAVGALVVPGCVSGEALVTVDRGTRSRRVNWTCVDATWYSARDFFLTQ